jgi:PAS domain S-box-containing protein
MLVLGSYLDFENEAMHAGHLEINIRLEKMARLNQELSNMLTIAVFERNALRSASYATVSNELELTINTIVSLTKTQNLNQEISSLIDGHAKLHSIEDNIIRFINEDRWEQARSVLFGDEYTLTRKTNEVDTETTVNALTGELDSIAKKFKKINTVAMALRISALILLLWVGIMFSRKSKADLAEQKRLSDEITIAYTQIEDKVNERTAQLGETTARLEIESEERLRSDVRTRLILNSAAEGFLGVDADGHVTFFNAAAEVLLGYKAEEVLDREIHGLIHHSHNDGTPYPWKDCPMFHACSRGESSNVSDEALWRKDGSMFPSEYSVTPLSDEKGKSIGAVMVFRDITERKKSLEESILRMEELQQFNRLVIGREERMIQLKEEVNTLLEQLGREKKYKAAEADEEKTGEGEGGRQI